MEDTNRSLISWSFSFQHIFSSHSSFLIIMLVNQFRSKKWVVTSCANPQGAYGSSSVARPNVDMNLSWEMVESGKSVSKVIVIFFKRVNADWVHLSAGNTAPSAMRPSKIIAWVSRVSNYGCIYAARPVRRTLGKVEESTWKRGRANSKLKVEKGNLNINAVAVISEVNHMM